MYKYSTRYGHRMPDSSVPGPAAAALSSGTDVVQCSCIRIKKLITLIYVAIVHCLVGGTVHNARAPDGYIRCVLENMLSPYNIILYPPKCAHIHNYNSTFIMDIFFCKMSFETVSTPLLLFPFAKRGTPIPPPPQP